MSAVPARAGLEASYKGREIEGLLDVHFYRPFGYVIALAARALRLSPAFLTVLGGAIGIGAGMFYRHAELPLTLIGMVLHVLSNAFDNADGQLARLTGTGSRAGRALDGLFDNLVFASIYLNLGLRLTFESQTSTIWLLVLFAAASHSSQSAAADYLRNAYLYFVGQKSELESSAVVQHSVQDLSWKENSWAKLLLSFYLNYTRQQERLMPALRRLRTLAGEGRSFGQQYRQECKGVTALAGMLTTNARMLVLFALLLFRMPLYYLLWEIVALNVVLAIVLLRHHAVATKLAMAVR